MLAKLQPNKREERMKELDDKEKKTRIAQQKRRQPNAFWSAECNTAIFRLFCESSLAFIFVGCKSQKKAT